MEKLSVREIATAGLIAAVYAVVSYFLAPVSFGVYQVRVAEALTVLPFLTRAAIPGLFIGCFLANIFGGNGWVDIVFGSLLTLAAAFLTRSVYHFTRRISGSLLAVLPIIMMWLAGIFLLSRFALSDYFFAAACLTVVSFAAVTLAVWGAERGKSRPFIDSALIVTSVAAMLVAAAMFRPLEWSYSFVVGALLLLAALLSTFFLARIWTKGLVPNILIAPLPPVVLNAFGVALYLAPIMGVNYWFAVQMIGVGQLVACYLLGLPLLALLQKRHVFQ